MKRLSSLIILILIPLLLFSASISPKPYDNPFLSVENLEAFNFANPEIEFPEIEINLITTETGSEVYSYFGHTSLEILTPTNRPIFYDYGYFTFSDGFYLNFVLGRLLYNVYATDGEMRIAYFEDEDRTVHRTRLSNLSTESKNAVFQFLRYNTRPENNTYLYDYYYDNCATRVRDIYNEATGGEFKEWASKIKSTTLRDQAARHMDKSPFISFTINFLEGPDIDKPITLYEECFLPLSLMKAIEAFEGKESEIIYESQTRESYRTHSLEFYALIFSIIFYFLSLLLYSSKIRFFIRLSDIINAIIYIYFALLSLVLAFVMAFTNHSVTYFNANLLYINPLIIIMAFEAIRGKKIRKRYIYSLISITVLASAFIFKALFPELFIQQNLSVIMVAASMYLVNISRAFLKE